MPRIGGAWKGRRPPAPADRDDLRQAVGAVLRPAVAGMTDPSGNSLMTLGIYLAVYTSLAYMLANSAFKMVDLMPAWAMSWIGARMESRVDDASAIQQMSSQYASTLAFSDRANEVDLGGLGKQNQQKKLTTKNYKNTG